MDRERFQRFQDRCRTVVARFDWTRFGSAELHEEFCRDLREAFLAAGATDGDLDALVVYLVSFVVRRTPGAPARRRELLEVIRDHVARTDITVRIGKDEAYVGVEFPHRARIHDRPASIWS